MSKTILDHKIDLTGDRDLYSGLIRLHVLHHAVEEPIFGLGMIEELARHGYRISPGSLYPLLHGLEKKGYLRSTERRNGKSLRRVYRATPLGQKGAGGRQRQSPRTAARTDGRQVANVRTKLGRACLAARVSAILLAASTGLLGQPAAPLTLTQAVENALRNYPSIRVSQEQMNAAAAGIQLARTAYLPRVDGLAQVNRATRNNVFGLLLPQSVIPSISGPVLGSNNFGTVWGSAVGALVTWEPFDFGLRGANVAAAAAARAQSEASLEANAV